jgi:hypothetical protein
MAEKNKVKFPHYFVAPNEIFDFEKSDLSVYAKIVYLYICRCENNSKAFPSYETVGTKCSIAKSTAQKAVKELVEAGLLIKSSGVNKGTYGKNASNRYDTQDPSKVSIPSRGTGGIPSHGTYKRTKNSSKKELPFIYLISENEAYMFSYYLKKYKETFGKEHPTMTKEKLDEIEQNYNELTTELDISEDTWINVVDYHFENLSKKNNGNVLGLLSNNAMNGGQGPILRYLEEVYDESGYI